MTEPCIPQFGTQQMTTPLSIHGSFQQLANLMQHPSTDKLPNIATCIATLHTQFRNAQVENLDCINKQLIYDTCNSLSTARNMLQKDNSSRAMRLWVSRWFTQFEHLYQCIDLSTLGLQNNKTKRSTSFSLQRSLNDLSDTLNLVSKLTKIDFTNSEELVQLHKTIQGIQSMISNLPSHSECITTNILPIQNGEIDKIDQTNTQLKTIIFMIDNDSGPNHKSYPRIMSRVYLQPNLIDSIAQTNHWLLELQPLLLSLNNKDDRKNNIDQTIATVSIAKTDFTEPKPKIEIPSLHTQLSDDLSIESRDDTPSRSTLSHCDSTEADNCAAILIYDSQYALFESNRCNSRHSELVQFSVPGGIAEFRHILPDETSEFVYNLKEEICGKRCTIDEKHKDLLLNELNKAQPLLKKGDTVHIDLATLFSTFDIHKSLHDSQQTSSYKLYQFFTAVSTKAYQSIEQKISDALNKPGYSNIEKKHTYDKAYYQSLNVLNTIYTLQDKLKVFKSNVNTQLAEEILDSIASIELDIMNHAQCLMTYKVMCLHYHDAFEMFIELYDDIHESISQHTLYRNQPAKVDICKLRALNRDFAGLRKTAEHLTRCSSTKHFRQSAEECTRNFTRLQMKRLAHQHIEAQLTFLQHSHTTTPAKPHKNSQDILKFSTKFNGLFGSRALLQDVTKSQKIVNRYVKNSY